MEDPIINQDIIYEYKISWKLIFSSFAAALGALQFGWNTGVINNPQNVISQFINNSLIQRDILSDSSDQLTAILATVVSIFAAGGLFGALLAGWFGDKFGRRNGMILNCFVMILSGIFMTFSKQAKSFEMMIIGRFLTGFGSGMYTGLVPIYLNEISPPDIRGSISLLMQFGVVIGIFLSQIFGLSVIMGNAELWNYLLGLVALLGLVQAICLKFSPQSPKYLLFYKSHELKAFLALQDLRTSDSSVNEEFKEMKMDVIKDKEENHLGLSSIWKNKKLRMALIVGIVLHLSQQLSGINNMFYYSSTLFQSVGVAQDQVEYATLGVGFIMIIVTAISISLVEKYGRRILHIGGLIGCLVTSILFTIFFTYKHIYGLNYCSIISSLLFVASFGIGPGSIPWIMIPEMFPASCRSSATSVGISVNWLSNLVVGLSFPYLLKALDNLMFLPYIVVHCLCIGFLFFKMPETKGRNTMEINEVYSEELPSHTNLAYRYDQN